MPNMPTSPFGSVRFVRTVAALAAMMGCVSSPAETIEEVAKATTVAEVAEPPGRSPRGVVQAQMQALSEWREDPQAAARVFELASLANRAVTGPISRFRQLVESKQYRALIGCTGWTAGEAAEAEGVAVVLVTLVDPQGRLHAYRFYLSQFAETDEESNEGETLWRTDAVFALPFQQTPAPPKRREDRSAI